MEGQMRDKEMLCSYCGKPLSDKDTYILLGHKTFCSEDCWRRYHDDEDDDLMRWDDETI